jgi:hypothetical protein
MTRSSYPLHSLSALSHDFTIHSLASGGDAASVERELEEATVTEHTVRRQATEEETLV